MYVCTQYLQQHDLLVCRSLAWDAELAGVFTMYVADIYMVEHQPTLYILY